MICKFSAQEVVNLVYYLNTTKKPIKKGLKKSHGSKEGKRQYELFKSMYSAFEDLPIDNELVEVNFEEEQLKTLNEFLSWYTPQLKENTSLEDPEAIRVIELLESTEIKVKGELLNATAV